MEFVFLIIVLILILFAEIINGWTDAPNAIATVVSTRTLPFRYAVIIAAVFNIMGAFYGNAVAHTIAKGIVNPEVMNLTTLFSSMLAVIGWGMTAWYLALPISKSHALIASITGAGLAAGGFDALIAEGWIKVGLGLIFSITLGCSVAWLVTKGIHFFFRYAPPVQAKRIFGRLQLFSSAFMALSHGSNDGQKFIGLFSLTLFLGNIYKDFHISMWVIMLCACTMGIGTLVGGMRIIRTMGVKMVPLQTYQGFAAETGSALTILFASHWGIPLSTTHTINMAIVGVGVAKEKKRVRWKVVEHIVFAWIFTFPICGLLAYLITHLCFFIQMLWYKS